MSEETKVENVESQEQAQQPAADLTVQDLLAIKQIIDVASQRGAFKPNEMAVVGTTYNKLEAFLNVAAAAQQQEQPEGE
jgi:hypothetical protein